MPAANEIRLRRVKSPSANEIRLRRDMVSEYNTWKSWCMASMLSFWGKDYPGDVRTVDVHVRRLREKIESNPSEPKYVHTKWGVGYYYKGI